MRVAIYATPPAGAALTRAAALWLGRDPFSGEPTREPDPDMDPLVAEPARYGFHATMRAPFRIREGFDLEDVDARLASFCASRPPVTLPAMKLDAIGSFFALVPAAPSAPLVDLEAALIEAFEPFRAELTEAEIARRRPDRLSERQRAHLDAYGYPHVLDDFRFHMTLTGSVPEADRLRIAPLLTERFAAFDGAPLVLESLALFLEPEPGAPFRVHSLHHFRRAGDVMSGETVLDHAQLVLADEILDGHLVLRGGRIAEIAAGRAGRGEDMGGDLLIPGLIELHTDHIEGHYRPRPRVRWNKTAALQAHDAQIAGSGITTVFDALRVGMDENADIGAIDMLEMGEAIVAAKAEGRLRADHFIHLRCEVSAQDASDGFRRFEGNPLLKLVSLMDHAPGQRQFVDISAYRVYHIAKFAGEAEFDAFCAVRVAESERYAAGNRAFIAQRCRALGIALASHDDATAAHVEESLALGVALAEFPTTLEAASASHRAGLKVLMGGPNVVRGGSHSGNVSALDLQRAGLLDILSSDYVPFSLIQAVFQMADIGAATLPQAVRLVTKHPAEAVGLSDRGEIAPGRRADLARIRPMPGAPPVVVAVYREGLRVA